MKRVVVKELLYFWLFFKYYILFNTAHFPKHPVSISSDTLGSSILRMSVFLFPVKSRSVPNYTSYNQKIPTAQFSVGHMDSSEAAFDRVPKKA